MRASGLHQDLADSNERTARLEREAAEHARLGAELAARLDLLEEDERDTLNLPDCPESSAAAD